VQEVAPDDRREYDGNVDGEDQCGEVLARGQQVAEGAAHQARAGMLGQG